MKRRSRRFRFAAAFGALLGLGAVWAPASGAHGDHRHPEAAVMATRSAKMLPPVILHDPRAVAVALPDGRVWVVTFFYGSCKEVCPALLHNAARVAEGLAPAERERIGVAAISFDPARDSPAALSRLEAGHELARRGVALLTGDPDAVATVTGAFGFAFMRDGAGGYDHVNLLAVMDPAGRVARHFYGLAPDPALVLEAARALVW